MSKKTDPLTVTLLIPPQELRPNSRCHWAAKARAVKRYRASSHWRAIAAGVPRKPWRAATVQAEFRYATKRRRDGDNLLACLKPALDSLADAGVIEDDAWLTHLPVSVALVSDKSQEGVVLTIRETKADKEMP